MLGLVGRACSPEEELFASNGSDNCPIPNKGTGVAVLTVLLLAATITILLHYKTRLARSDILADSAC